MKRNPVQFTDAQRSFIAQALRRAAETYEGNAKEIMAAASDNDGSLITKRGGTSLADQFDRQAREAKEFANIVEQADDIGYMPREAVLLDIGNGKFDLLDADTDDVIAEALTGKQAANKYAERNGYTVTATRGLPMSQRVR